MPLESDKIMFEIFREEGYSRRYRAIYFTELDEHNKESEINAAMAGDHFFDGFLLASTGEEAKRAIDVVLRRLNSGEPVSINELEQVLGPYLAG